MLDNLTPVGRLQVLHTQRELQARLERRLQALRIQLSNLQQEVDDLVAIKSDIEFIIMELEK
jgi:hypothetical protein